MLKLLESGVRVYAVAPPGTVCVQHRGNGSRVRPLGKSAAAVLNPSAGADTHFSDLMRIYRRLKPDLVQHYTVKPNVYGAVAARLAGVPVVFGGVVGLGSAFAPGGFKRGYAAVCACGPSTNLGTALSDRMAFQIEHDAQRLCGNSTREGGRRLSSPAGHPSISIPSARSLHHRRNVRRSELSLASDPTTWL